MDFPSQSQNNCIGWLSCETPGLRRWRAREDDRGWAAWSLALGKWVQLEKFGGRARELKRRGSLDKVDALHGLS